MYWAAESADSGWINPASLSGGSFGAGWSGVVVRLIANRVLFGGAPTGGSSGTTLLTLPSVMRPQANQAGNYISGQSGGTAGTGTNYNIATSGVVTIFFGAISASSILGVTFTTD